MLRSQPLIIVETANLLIQREGRESKVMKPIIYPTSTLSRSSKKHPRPSHKQGSVGIVNVMHHPTPERIRPPCQWIDRYYSTVIVIARHERQQHQAQAGGKTTHSKNDATGEEVYWRMGDCPRASACCIEAESEVRETTYR